MYPRRPVVLDVASRRLARRTLSQLYCARGVPRASSPKLNSRAGKHGREGRPYPWVVVVDRDFKLGFTGPEGALTQKKLEAAGNSGYSLPTSHNLMVSPRARVSLGSPSVFPDRRTGSLCCTAQDGTVPE